ncbi:hypothetical protein [Psychrobacter sp. DAB_AL43B]|uniref:hypothetical protein n=1 Tax=Psychrobacter sp. DAB_AL43B TaxID=1028416 RepID=UPI0009A5C87A|nr:hypothetical protein [Psychrobacter sp. DAB_AL43B]
MTNFNTEQNEVIDFHDNPNGFTSLKNVAKFFDVSNQTIKRWYKAAKFPAPVANPLDDSESAHKFFRNRDLIEFEQSLRYEEPA